MTNIAKKYTPEWINNIRNLIVKKDDANDKLLQEINTVAQEIHTKQAQIDTKNQKINETSDNYLVFRELEKQEKLWSDNLDDYEDSWNNFLTIYRTDGWKKLTTDYYSKKYTYGAVRDYNNLYSVYISKDNVGSYINITEPQLFKNLAQNLNELVKVNATAFLAKITAATPAVFPHKTTITTDLATIQGFVNNGIGDNIITNSDHPHHGKPSNCDENGNNGFTEYHFKKPLTLAVFDALIQFADNTAHTELLNILTDTEVGNITKTAEITFRPAQETALTTAELKKRGIETANATYYDTDFDNTKLKKGEVKNGFAGWIYQVKQNFHSEQLAKFRSSLDTTATADPYVNFLLDLSTFDKKTATFNQSNANTATDPTYTLFDFPKSYQEVASRFGNAKTRYEAIKDNNKTLIKEITDLEKEIEEKEATITEKKTTIETVITAKINQLKDQLAKHNPEKDFTVANNNLKSLDELCQIRNLIENIRYLQHGSNEIPSDAPKETTAFDNAERIKLAAVGSLPFNFHQKAWVSDGVSDNQKAIDYYKTTYAFMGGLKYVLDEFNKYEKLIVLTEKDKQAKLDIETYMGKEDNKNEKITDWQTKLKALDATLDETVITDAWKTKWSEIGNHQTISKIETLLKKVIGADNKVKPDFLTEITKADATLIDLKTLLVKRPKDIITYISLWEYNNLTDEGEDKDKPKTQWIRKVKKALKDKDANFDTAKDLTAEQIKEAVYKIAVGELTLTTNSLKADLTEYTTETPEKKHDETEQGHFEKYWPWYAGGMVIIIAGFALWVFRDKLFGSGENKEENVEDNE